MDHHHLLHRDIYVYHHHSIPPRRLNPPLYQQFLDGKHTIFGEVAEGLDTVLKEINELYCDSNGRPYRYVMAYAHNQKPRQEKGFPHFLSTSCCFWGSPPLLSSRDVRILHTYVLEDPFDDPPGMDDLIPDASPTTGRPEQEVGICVHSSFPPPLDVCM